MKVSGSSPKVVVAITAVLMIVGFVALSYWWNTFLDESHASETIAHGLRNRVPVGTPWSEAVAILSQDAWERRDCGVFDGIHIDIFFYGSRKYDRAGIIYLRSTSDEISPSVEFVGTLDYYMVRTYDYCNTQILKAN